MGAKIVSVSPGLIWPIEVRYLAFFPNASEYLRYGAHWHVQHTSGMRQNLPLEYGFVVVREGKFDIKSCDGKVVHRIHVASDQIWRLRETQRPVPELYAMCVGGREAYERSGGARALARAL